MYDLSFFTNSGIWIFDLVEFDSVFIGQVIEKIQIIFCNLSFLFISKNQIDPITNMLAHIIWLKFLPMFDYEIIGRRCPNRNLDVMNSLLFLCDSKIVLVYVQQILWEVESLGWKLTDVG